MPPMRAIIFMGLNAVRFLSIVTLLLVFASQIVVMVTNIKAVNVFETNAGNATDYHDCDYIDGSTVPNQPAGVFWAVVATLLIIFQSIVLLLSEVGWPIKFFDRYFPVLGSNFGLGPLGIFQGLIATQILSHHVDDFTLVSAFFLFAIGCLNMLLGLIFRESAKEKRSITSWRAESKGILPQTTGPDAPKRILLAGKGGSAPFIARSLSTNTEKSVGYGWSTDHKPELGSFKSTDKAGFGFGRQGEKAAGLRGFILQRPEESLPRYASPTPPVGGVTRKHSARSSSSSFSSPFRGSKEVRDDDDDDACERSSSRATTPFHSRSNSRTTTGERSGTPVPKFKSSSTAV
ncbi:hypothetical protein AX15_006407 [Amanita polypyramis BW_CC]|nr:hypothetical protein AX15_006407 [Amanita polypyramis BW_CC]